MSEFKRLPSYKKVSSPKRESKSFNKNTVKGNYMNFKRSTCPVRGGCSRETEKQTTQVNNKEEERRRESLSPPRKLQIIGHSSSSGCQSSTSVNQSSNNVFDSYRDGTTSKNLQHDKDKNSSLSLGSDLSDTSSFIKSHISKLYISSRDGSFSPGSSLVQPPTNSFDDLPSCNVKNINNLMITNANSVKPHSTKEQANAECNKSVSNLTDSTNYLSKHNKSTDNLIPISEDEMSVDCSQTNDFVDNDNLNTNDVNSEGSQLFQMDPALRQFDVLDELEASDQEEGEIMESNSEKSDSEFDEELPIDDIDEMLEEGLPEKFKSSKNKECPVQLRKKVVLEEIGHDHFDLLPEGWIQIMHSCGMPVYLNQKSRVCTMARPYYLGPGSSRNHKIPLSAIPCLHYKRASELEKKNEEEREKKKQSQNHQSQSEIELMSAEIETFEENKATQSLEASELHEYCKNVFKFKTLTLIPFKSWADRRKYVKMRRETQRKQRPTLPGGTKLLKFPIRNPDGTVSKTKGEWIINPNGKSYVCILHEYVQHALKKHPKYEFKELENPATPYSATVFIEEMKYGFGMGASKKHAKVEAAKAALEVLIPGMKDKIEPDSQFGVRSGTTKRSNDTDMSIFDQIRVEDPRVAEFCAKSTEPPPYAILLTCLSRNTGVGEIEVKYEMSSKNFRQDEFTMIVGNHKATVACKNKREGKQRAAQAILKKLHPNIIFWGSLLRMYGNRSIKEIKEKKQAELEITELQSKATLNQPNYAILNKLKTEMLKLKNKKDALKGKGKFILPEHIILPSLSSTDLNKVNLSNK